MKQLALVLAVGVIAVSVRAEPEIKGTPSEVAAYLAGIPKVVIISGESEVKIQADRAYVRIKVSTEGKSLQEALNKNALLRQQITDELRKSGIAEGNISGSKFASRPQYGMLSDKAKSYKIENTIRVLVGDEAQLRFAASSIDAHAEAAYDGVEFEDSNELANKQRALREACQDAVNKKALYEQGLGVTLTPQAFAESGLRPIPVHPEFGGTYDYDIPASKSLPKQEVATANISQFGEITYRTVVTVNYQVAPQR